MELGQKKSKTILSQIIKSATQHGCFAYSLLYFASMASLKILFNTLHIYKSISLGLELSDRFHH